VKGELLMAPPPGAEHGAIGMNLAAPLHLHVKNKNLGVVYAAETGFKLESNPDTVRALDVAFVRKDRVEQTGRIPGYHSGAPDLVVEVLSPSDTVGKVEAKGEAMARDWRANGLGGKSQTSHSHRLSLTDRYRDPYRKRQSRWRRRRAGFSNQSSGNFSLIQSWKGNYEHTS
jgi:hypothetical protein